MNASPQNHDRYLKDRQHPARPSQVLPRSRIRDGERAIPVFIPTGTEAPTPSLSQSTAGHTSHAAPRVHVVREGNLIKAIEVTCVCGHDLRLICEY